MSSEIPGLRLKHAYQVLSVDWNKYWEELLAVGSIDGTISIWDLRMAQIPVSTFKGHSHAIKRVQWSPHKARVLLTVSYDTSICLWDMKNFSIPTPLEILKHHTEFVYGSDFNLHRIDELASCGFDEMVFIFRPNSLVRYTSTFPLIPS